ncbi:MAG: glycosyltransferase family 2 protein [Sphingomonadales bacterium]
MQSTTQMEGPALPPAVAVVIPYFQRKPGILARALESVFAQDYVQPFDLLIVDDESPVPAQSELAGLQAPAHVRVSILGQKNGGPGAARNAGLDEACRRGIEIVAFLDSDDRWSQDHLRRGIEAIGHGFDIYAANWSLLGESDDQADAHSARGLIDADFEPFEVIAGTGRFLRPLLTQQLQGSVLKMSALVFNFQRFQDVRFNTSLRNASEDRLFTYELGLTQPKVLLSRRMEVFSGTGVNIYASATWGSAQSYPVYRDQLAGTRIALKLLRGHPKERELVKQQRREIQESLARHSLHMFAQRQSFDKKILAKIILLEPMVLFRAVMVVIRQIWAKVVK